MSLKWYGWVTRGQIGRERDDRQCGKWYEWVTRGQRGKERERMTTDSVVRDRGMRKKDRHRWKWNNQSHSSYTYHLIFHFFLSEKNLNSK